MIKRLGIKVGEPGLRLFLWRVQVLSINDSDLLWMYHDPRFRIDVHLKIKYRRIK